MVFFFQAEDGIRDVAVTGVQTCALPISFLLPHRFTGCSALGARDSRLRSPGSSIRNIDYGNLADFFSASVASTQHELCVPGSFATPRVGAGSVAPDGYPGGMHSHFLLANSCRVSACFSGSARSGTCN